VVRDDVFENPGEGPVNRAATAQVWDDHWQSIDSRSSFFGRIASVVRTQLLSRAVCHYAERFFPGEGVFLECGCGTAQSSARIARKNRRMIALDFSLPALQAARRVPIFDGEVQGDIFHLPAADDSVSGIWNLGVMEHFSAADGRRILEEFRRVLKPGACAVLFWPPKFGSSRWVLGPIEAFLSWKRKTPVRFFPDEVNRIRSREHARRTLAEAGLEVAAADLTPRDGFIHLVVVGRKPRT
jgi:SAM-dependent methyltransferase